MEAGCIVFTFPSLDFCYSPEPLVRHSLAMTSCGLFAMHEKFKESK